MSGFFPSSEDTVMKKKDSKRLSHYPVLTLRENPADCEIPSDRYLMRAGMIRKITAGIFAISPIGLRIVKKIERIIREEMDHLNGLELQLPILVDADLWKQSKRWVSMGDELFRLTDRKKHQYLLGPTHEETITVVIKQLIKSYRDLPLNVYQIQPKFRDELRPRFGIIRCREFTMKDAYSFHLSEHCLDQTYKNMIDGYRRIFKKLALNVMLFSADSSGMGGSQSEEFIMQSDMGEEEYMYCNEGNESDFRAVRSEVVVDWQLSCDKKSNGKEMREKIIPKQSHNSSSGENSTFKYIMQPNFTVYPLATTNTFFEEIAISQKKVKGSLRIAYTPKVNTIVQLSEFLKCRQENILKALVYRYQSQGDIHYCMACIRGDRSVSEIKLKNLLNAQLISLATTEQTQELFSLEHDGNDDSLSSQLFSHGFIGPIYREPENKGKGQKIDFLYPIFGAENGVKKKNGLSIEWEFRTFDNLTVLFDRSLVTNDRWIVGCNRNAYHFVDFTLPSEQENPDFYCDFSLAKKGDYPQINHGQYVAKQLNMVRGIELGHLFKLGRTYSEKLELQVLNSQGVAENPLMGCYGIGVGRLLAAIVEQNYCEPNILWPKSVTPFDIIIISLGKDPEILKMSEEFYCHLAYDFEILWDDRPLQNGVKLNDAELFGIPIQIRIGKQFLEKKRIELLYREITINQNTAKREINYEKSFLQGSISQMLAEVKKKLKLPI